MFVRNAWYVGAFSQELSTMPVARMILGEPVVLYRTASGKAVALEDQCCHRGLPLSMGDVDGEILRCHYHGLEFGSSGACTSIPGQDRIPPSAKVRSYPVVEQDQIVWMWTGDPAKADPGLIYPYPFHQRESGWVTKIVGRWDFACNWEMINDNLLDLTHLPFVHKSTIGGDTQSHVNAIMEVTPTERGVQFVRRLPNSIPPTAYLAAVPFKGRIDRWQEFEAVPGLVVAYTGGTDANTGAFEGKRDGGLQNRVFNALTPETETTTHYFWSQSRNFELENEALTEQFTGLTIKTFQEDQLVLKEQQKRISARPTRELVDIRSDSAGLAMRRAMRRLHAAEQESGAIAAE